MTDSGNHPHPVRTLTVKNFSVIKEAKLEFGKITVLIGPQSSGKSLLCKLAYFLGQIVPEAANELALLRLGEEKLFEVIAQEFQERFPPQSWGHESGEITFSSGVFNISLSISPKRFHIAPRINREFLEEYRQFIERHVAEGSAKDVIKALRTGAVGAVGPFRFDESVYIPTGRAFFSTPNRGFASVSKNLDWITQRFSNEIDWEYRAMLEPSGPSSDLLPQFVEDARGILGGSITRENGTLLFRSTRDDRELPLQWLSSGTQEMLPLMNPLSTLVHNVSANPARVWEHFSSHIGPIYVEEPELSVFPATQYELVKLFAWLAGEERLEFPFVITTHSPYILTAFNDLIKAGLIAEEQPGKASAVAKVIPRQYWIKPSDFAAYAFDGKDGILRSIMDQETQMINGDILDDISSDIADEFGQLLEIQYGGR